ncbi:hypothetical protein J8F10_19045 [Gemmata sp. G18]|uniref:Uncharacterized protein n=1 Tax=Gemmata palustris TaxID=2822762 RepID=A0ABS5BUE0_9BACT|nr:hypothetical protein [Gemmata palustris]MBP3957347.1 hypothetical protein [Gemmata palustris]
MTVGTLLIGVTGAILLFGGWRETPPVGVLFANNDYRDSRANGVILIGFEVGFGKAFDTG